MFFDVSYAIDVAFFSCMVCCMYGDVHVLSVSVVTLGHVCLEVVTCH